MDNMQTASSVLSSAIIEWLADEALQQSEPAKLLGELCLRLRAVGIPVMRSQLAFRVLHPLYDASTLTWSMKQDVLVENFRPRPDRPGAVSAQPGRLCPDQSPAGVPAQADRSDSAA